MYCRNCGAELKNNTAYCPTCGYRTSDNQQPQQPHVTVVNNNPGYNYIRKSKWTAFFLCLFLGEFGIHRFYVGKVGTGLIWLFTLGFFGIGWLIDLIVILCGGFRDKAGQPLA